MGSGIMTWQLKDGTFLVPLAGGQFQLTGPNNFSLTIIDNVTPADQDPAGGSFKVMGLLPGIYTLCETVPPPKFLLPDPKFVSPCTKATIVSGGTNSGYVLLQRAHSARHVVGRRPGGQPNRRCVLRLDGFSERSDAHPRQQPARTRTMRSESS
jgi:hypothetical protein